MNIVVLVKQVPDTYSERTLRSAPPSAPRFSRTPARSPVAPDSGPVDVHQLIETWCPAPVPDRT
jgi:hypothetical protein